MGKRRGTQRVAFSKTAITALPLPQRRDRVYVYDTRTPGLAVCVSKTGSRVFYCYRWTHGRPERIRLGRFPELSIEQARKLVAGYVAQIANGENPQARRRAARDESTLRELFDHYVELHGKPHKRSWQADVRLFDRHLDRWQRRQLSTITRADVQRLHGRIGADHPYQANRVVELLRALFNHAARHGWNKMNPAAKIRKFTEQSRERFLGADELPRFLGALASESDEDFRDFVSLALFTGGRRSNVSAMAWEHIDIDSAAWIIPGSEHKNRQTTTVVLPPPAVGILKRRLAASDGSPWVFPSWGSSGHYVEPKKAWAKLLERAGITGLRLHDLRRTLGSWQAAGGSSLAIIGKSLGHKSLAATSVYARLELDPVRASVNKATSAMLALAPPDESEGDNGD